MRVNLSVMQQCFYFEVLKTNTEVSHNINVDFNISVVTSTLNELHSNTHEQM